MRALLDTLGVSSVHKGPLRHHRCRQLDVLPSRRKEGDRLWFGPFSRGADNFQPNWRGHAPPDLSLVLHLEQWTESRNKREGVPSKNAVSRPPWKPAFISVANGSARCGPGQCVRCKQNRCSRRDIKQADHLPAQTLGTRTQIRLKAPGLGLGLRLRAYAEGGTETL